MSSVDANGFIVGRKRTRPEFLVKAQVGVVKGRVYERGIVHVGIVSLNKSFIGRKVRFKLEHKK